MYLPLLWAAVFNQSNLLSLSSEISLEVRVLLNKESPNIIRIFCSKSSKWPGLECWKEKVPAILARALFCLCPLCRIEMGSPRCWLWQFFSLWVVIQLSRWSWKGSSWFWLTKSVTFRYSKNWHREPSSSHSRSAGSPEERRGIFLKYYRYVTKEPVFHWDLRRTICWLLFIFEITFSWISSGLDHSNVTSDIDCPSYTFFAHSNLSK